MADKKQRSEGFEEFKKQYDAAEIPNHGKPINSSPYNLKEQLGRFAEFSHNEDESEILSKEAAVL